MALSSTPVSLAFRLSMRYDVVSRGASIRSHMTVLQPQWPDVHKPLRHAGISAMRSNFTFPTIHYFVHSPKAPLTSRTPHPTKSVLWPSWHRYTKSFRNTQFTINSQCPKVPTKTVPTYLNCDWNLKPSFWNSHKILRFPGVSCKVPGVSRRYKKTSEESRRCFR